MSDKGLYFIAIVPEAPLYEELMWQKRFVADHFQSKAALNSPPHITLHMPFKWRSDREGPLLEKLTEFHFSGSSFEIQLKNFDFFEPRVVFIDVIENPVLRSLFTELSKHIRKELKLVNADYKSRGFQPHVTIAFRDLKKPKFFEAKDYFDRQVFEARFFVDGFWILKHDGRKWNPFRFFHINNSS
ncbi:2'-5' RNA ligase family protein [Reichenbachiella versicolor]|uniref:2'-5' RNA ligase family protein n=1 Tax=Reichenbachiella versicolor TaxID=1821036 RepID=UPI000D6E58F8|nr:2'-5' RNA ligase family protein [Reichenbachiella versicolor]